METIETISGLISKLKENSSSEYGAILNQLELSDEYIQDCSSWSSEKYTRNCLYKDDAFELLLLCWEQGQKTPVHCHGGEECWVKLISGELNEVFYENDATQLSKAIKSQKLDVNGLSYMNDLVGLHSLENTNNGKSISLHLYAKPIKRCRYYDTEKGAFVYNDMSYDVDLCPNS